MMLHTYTPKQCPYQVSTSYTLQFLRYSPDNLYRLRSLQQGQRSNQGHIMTIAHLQPPANVPTKYQLPTPYAFRDIAWTRFYRARSLRQGQIKVTP